MTAQRLSKGGPKKLASGHRYDRRYDVAVSSRRCAIVVVNFDSADLIALNVVPLARARPDVHVVIVDNLSKQAAREDIRALCNIEGWALVESAENCGFGSGMNLGVAEARGAGADTWLLLNPDVSLAPESFDLMVRAVADEPMSIVSPRILRPDGSVWFDRGVLDLTNGRAFAQAVDLGGRPSMPWLTGACLMTTAEVWDVLGGFDDDYFLYWEDVDLSFRANEWSINLTMVDSAVAVHDEGGTQDRSDAGDFSQQYYYFNIRNRLVFAAKVLPDATRRRWLMNTPRETYLTLLRGVGKRKFLRPREPLACATRAIYDGLVLSRRSKPRDRRSNQPS